MRFACEIFAGVYALVLFAWVAKGLRRLSAGRLPMCVGRLRRKFGYHHVALTMMTFMVAHAVSGIAVRTNLLFILTGVPVLVICVDDLVGRDDRPRKRRLSKLLAKLKKFSPPKLLPKPLTQPLPRPA